MDKLIIIGANEFQKKLVIKAKKMGYETHVFAWEEGAVAKLDADCFYPISITEKEDILKVVKDLKPVGVCSIASDLAVPAVNYIAKDLGLIGNSQDCTIYTTNKYEMRKLLTKNGMPCPKFKLIEDIEQVNLEYMNYPLIIKPIDRSGSRGIYKVENDNDLSIGILEAKNVSQNKEVLIEEYIDGKEYSVEFISQNREHHFLQITEKFTTGSPNFIEKGHLSPARLSLELKNEIIKVVKKSLDVLGVVYGASHSEVKVTDTGEIKIIEIASRMGGDFIGSDMVKISTGYDFVEGIIQVAVNEPIDVKVVDNNKIALVGFIFNQRDKENFNKVKDKYPNIIKEYDISCDIGEVKDSSTRNGYYLLEIENSEKLTEILDELDLEV